MRQTFKPFRKAWINVEIKKVDTHKRRTVKVLLDNRATKLLMSKRLAQKRGYKLIKLDQPLLVKNINGTGNSRGAIIHEVKVNMFFKGYVEKVRINVCKLEKTKIILDILWLAIHNPEIDWEKEEIKITKCPPLCGKFVRVQKRCKGSVLGKQPQT